MERRLELISEMTPAIWLHLIAALIAVVLGALVLWRRKGDRRHKLLGRAWVALMGIVALSSFFITQINGDWFSPIHALSVWTLVSLTLAVRAIRAKPRQVEVHARHLQTLYASAILIAGGFTFLPTRLLGRLTFGESMPLINWTFVALCTLGGIALIWFSGKQKSSRP